jgi:ethanolamine ammonia-lyase large subunit
MGVPCADDVMLNYQSTSFHDAMAVRRLFSLRQAPEFARWMEPQGWWAAPAVNGEDQLARERVLQQLGTVLEKTERIT